MEEFHRGGKTRGFLRPWTEGARSDGAQEHRHIRGDESGMDDRGARLLQAEPDDRHDLLDARRRSHCPRHQRDGSRHCHHQLRSAAEIQEAPRQST